MFKNKKRKTAKGTFNKLKEATEEENRLFLEIEKNKLKMDRDASIRLFVDKSSK